MSRGPGAVEGRIADLFVATRDRALSVEDLADNAYRLNGAKATREQSLSATRAAHRVRRRVKEAYERAEKLRDKAHADTKAALGREGRPYDRPGLYLDKAYDERFGSDPACIEANKLFEFCQRVGQWSRWYKVDRDHVRAETDHWQTTTIKKRLFFHPADVPVQVWAVRIDRRGVHWFDAKVIKVTERNVMVEYAGERARLDRESLYKWWAFWRRVRFVSMRTGRIAAELEKHWFERDGSEPGGVPPAMRMPLVEARLLLGVPVDYTREDVIAAFRREAKKAHPDLGGTAEMFYELVEARDRLLSALGTRVPAPNPPTYAPTGVRVVYRSSRTSLPRLSSATPRLALRKCYQAMPSSWEAARVVLPLSAAVSCGRTLRPWKPHRKRSFGPHPKVRLSQPTP